MKDDPDIKKYVLDNLNVEIDLVVWITENAGSKEQAAIRHCGEHIRNMSIVGRSKGFQQALRLIRRNAEIWFSYMSRQFRVVFVCHNGRHRSVASAKIMCDMLTLQGDYRTEGPFHLSRPMWDNLCSTCQMCQPSKDTKDLMVEIMSLIGDDNDQDRTTRYCA